MPLSHFAIARPITILMVVAGILLFGAIAFDQLGLELLPDLSFPMNAVITVYPSADAETIEKTVTAKVEDAVSTVSNLKQITSTSYENISVVLTEFDWGTDLAEATQEITVALEALHYTLPSAAQKPLVMQFDPSQIPISLVGLSSNSLSIEELTRLAEEEIVPLIERTPGVARTSLSGGIGQAIHVVYDSAKLRDAGISDTLLAQMLPAQNVLVPIGAVYDDGKRYIGKAGMEINSIDELKRLVVGVTAPEEAGSSGLLGMSLPNPVYLEDVADVMMAHSEMEGFTRVNGRPALLITVMKRSGENTVLVSDRMEQALNTVAAKLDQVQIHYITDQAKFIRRSIKNIGVNGIAGAVIAAAVLLIFLKSISSTLIISLAIPLSVMATFILMYLSKLTMNIMTLGGLALGVGMLVDNAIVVLENIHRHQELGRSPGEASGKGASEVASAITASTLTTLAVFLPVVFLRSFAGHLFTDLSLTVSFSLLASLLVALTVVPTMASRTLWRRGRLISDTAQSPDSRPAKSNAGFESLRSRYLRILEWSLDHKWIVLTVSLLLFIVSLCSFFGLETEFLPDTDMGMVAIDVVLPPGTPVAETNSVVEAVESVLSDMPGIHAYSSQVGRSDPSSTMSVFSSLPSNRGDLDIMLLPNAQRTMSTEDTADRINAALEPVRARYQQARIEARATDQIAYATGLDQSSLAISITGDDFEVLSQLSNDLAGRLEKIQGVEHIEQSVNDVQPVAILDVNHAKALTSSLTAGQIGLSVRSQLLGVTVTDLRLDGELIPVVLMSKAAASKDLDDLTSLQIAASSPAAVGGSSGGSENSGLASLLSGPPTLGRITTLRQEMKPTTIIRNDGMRAVTIDASTSHLALGTAQKLVRDEVDTMEIPEGYDIHFTGIMNIMQESLDSLKLALLLALLLVYMVMAAQFESLVSPFIVMCSVPLATIGSVLALRLTGSRLGVISVVGMIVLVGIVVNNAIVMVDFINRQRKESKDLRSAILQAGRERLRPILMTATTTILGLLPLAIGVGRFIGFGEANEIQAPLAIAVIGGLVTATLLTLVVIPAVYEAAHSWLELRRKARPAPSLFVILCLAVIGASAITGILSTPASAEASLDPGGSVPRSAIPGPFRLPTFEFKSAHVGFGLVHSAFDPSMLSFPSLTNLLVTPEVRLRADGTDIVASLGVSFQYNPTECRTTVGMTSCVSFTKRRMVQFGVFRNEVLAVSYQWLPGRIPDGSDGLAIAGRDDKDKAGAIAASVGVETAVGRVALTTAASFASPTFDTALARAAHEFSIMRPGAAGLQCTVRWHQYTSVATICRGAIAVDSRDGTITCLATGGVYGSPLPWLDYSVLIGAEAGVHGTVPAVDLNVTFKDLIRPGSRLILEIHKETGTLGASLRAKWPLE